MKQLCLLFILVTSVSFAQSDSVQVIKVEQPKDACYTVAGVDTVYESVCVEAQPEFGTGSSAMYIYIGKRLQYPYTARELGIQGKVFVKFAVFEDGSVRNAKIMKGIKAIAKDSTKQEQYDAAAKLMNDGALEVIAGMPEWHPGEINGKKVKVWFIIPINYKLQ